MRLVDSAYEQMKAKMAEDQLELVTQFFMIFSLFERAMKRTNFQYTQNNGNIQASWQTLSSKLDCAEWTNFLDENLSCKRAYSFLESNNPNHLTGFEDDCDGDFSPLEPRQQYGPAIQHLLGVRNNLFHGEKIDAYKGFFVKPSDIEYLEHSLCLLDALLQFIPELKREFFSGLKCPGSN